MKIVKIACLALASALLFASCNKNADEKISGTYMCIPDIEVSAQEGSGIIFNEMEEAVQTAAAKYNFRTKESDAAVIAAADKVEAERKDYANKKIKIDVAFKEGNVAGQPEKTPVVLKSYTFTPPAE